MGALNHTSLQTAGFQAAATACGSDSLPYYPALQPAPDDGYAPSAAPTPPLSTPQKVTAFFKGLLSPLYEPFTSPAKFLMASGVFLAHAVIIGATGGAAAPFFLVLAAGTAAYQTAKGVYALHNAQTPEERKKAFYNLGAGIGNIGLLAFGAKTALKEGGQGGLKNLSPEAVDAMSPLQATVQNFKSLPDSVKTSYETIRDGHGFKNTKEFTRRQVDETSEKYQQTKHKIRQSVDNHHGDWTATTKDLLADIFKSIPFLSLFN